MQSKTGKIASLPEYTGSTIAPDDSMIPYSICFEDAPIGMAITTMDGKVLHLNKALLSLTGYNKEESTRINASRLYRNPQERNRFISHIRKEKKVNKFETEFVHKEGYPIQMRMTSVLISLGPEEALMTMVEDITASKRIEKELKISQQAIETSINAIAMTDLNGNLTYVNPACLHMWGYDDPSQVLGKAVISFCHSLEEASKVLSEVQKNGRWAGELVAKRADGTTFVVQVAANVVRGEEGDPICLMSSFVNVSERRRAERALRDSENQYRMALDAMGDAITLVDRDLRITLANKIIKDWCLALGISPSIEGLSLFDAFPFLHEDKVRQEYQCVFDTGEAITTQESVIINEKEIITETRKSPVFEEGRVVQVLSAVRDVTEKACLEKAIIESEKKYRNIFENTLVGIYQSTLEGRYLSANPAIAKMFGYETPETFMAGITDIGKQLYVNPSDRERSMQVLQGSERLESFEVQTRRRDGSLMWNLINSRPVRDKDGKFQYIEGVIIDTTKLKQTEEALRSSQERFSKAFRSSPAPMVISTLTDGRFIDVNRRFSDMLEYNRNELIDRTSEELRIWENPEQRHFGVTWLQQNGPIREKPVRFKTKNGGYRDALWSAEIIRIDGSQYMLSLIYDITERKQAENDLRESEMRYRSLFENMLSGYAYCKILSEDGSPRDFIYLEVNSAVEKLTGLKNVVGKKVSEVIPGIHESNPELLQIYSRVALTGRPERFETYLEPLAIWFSVSVYSPEKEYFVAVFDNITERKQAHDELRRYSEEIRDLYDNAPCGYHSLDADGTFMRINDTELNWLGSIRDDLVGKKKFSDFMTPESREVFQKNYPLFKERGWIKDVEYQLTRRDGTLLPVILNATAIEDNDGNFLQSRASLFDNTERKKIEEERKGLEERLQRSEKMESLGMLAGGVAHDLNNVLGILIGYSELLADEIDDSSPIRTHIKYIKQGGERAAAIVQDLLTLARRGVQTKEVVNLNDIITDAEKLPELEKILSFHPGVRIKTKQDADLLNIKGSPVHLSKTLMNLISNAAEAMKTGGLLTLATCNEYLDRPVHGYDTVREGDYVILTVSDTGEGISASVMKRIFEPFYTKKVMGRSGTGLGLAVVWGTVRDHDGYINVESEEGKGTTFTLYIPATREDISGEQKQISAHEYIGNGETVLIVDDVEGQRELACRMLKKLNYEAMTVSSGEEAVEYLRKNEVDLVVLDMIMDPGMDGLDTYKKILEIQPRQKAIIVSGFSESVRVRQAQELGAGAYVKKPYLQERLGIAVRKELNKSM